MLFPGGTAAPYLDDADEVWSAIAGFLGHEPSPKPMPVSPATRSGMCVILFTDIVGSTALTQRLGAVRGLARTSAGVTFEERGMQDLKGVTDPLRVYAVKSAST